MDALIIYREIWPSLHVLISTSASSVAFRKRPKSAQTSSSFPDTNHLRQHICTVIPQHVSHTKTCRHTSVPFVQINTLKHYRRIYSFKCPGFLMSQLEELEKLHFNAVELKGGGGAGSTDGHSILIFEYTMIPFSLIHRSFFCSAALFSATDMTLKSF